ncbi:MAG TPA: RNA polymerase sigma factor [Patescibacteria group bacterium]|nr:RNA polymerase sigma factor [Patescibacteria group bacterium]
MKKCAQENKIFLNLENLINPIPCPIGGICQEKTDEQLVMQAKENKDCFIYLMERYETKIQRYVMKISGLPWELVQDLTQDIFVKVYTNLDRFDVDKKFSSWIYRIARNETINYWLYSQRRKTENWDVSGSSQSFISDGRNLENDIFQKINNEELVKTFKNLGEKYQEVIALNYLEGKSYQEIARELNKPVATIGTLLNRARKILKQELLKVGFTSETALGS